MNNEIELNVDMEDLYSEISGMVFEAKNDLKKRINLSVISLYWDIGKVLSEDVLNGLKPEYGKNVIGEISNRLSPCGEVDKSSL